MVSLIVLNIRFPIINSFENDFHNEDMKLKTRITQKKIVIFFLTSGVSFIKLMTLFLKSIISHHSLNFFMKNIYRNGIFAVYIFYWGLILFLKTLPLQLHLNSGISPKVKYTAPHFTHTNSINSLMKKVGKDLFIYFLDKSFS